MSINLKSSPYPTFTALDIDGKFLGRHRSATVLKTLLPRAAAIVSEKTRESTYAPWMSGLPDEYAREWADLIRDQRHAAPVAGAPYIGTDAAGDQRWQWWQTVKQEQGSHFADLMSQRLNANY